MRTFWRIILIRVSLKTPPSRSFRGRDPQALLVDLGGVGRHRSRRHAADVLVMGHGAAQRDHLAAMEDRRDDGDIGQMRAAV
jgi:hypothetical protein